MKAKMELSDESVEMLIKNLTIIQNITENENIIKLAEDCLNLVRIPYVTYSLKKMVEEKQVKESMK